MSGPVRLKIVRGIGLQKTIKTYTLLQSGARGPAGPGLPSGGLINQMIRKTASAVDYATEWFTLRIIKGQYDDTISHTPSDIATVTLDYEPSNSQHIDASALVTGEAFTIAASNWPAANTTTCMILALKIGTDKGVNITWPNGVTAPELVADNTHWYVMSSLNGTSFRLAESVEAS